MSALGRWQFEVALLTDGHIHGHTHIGWARSDSTLIDGVGCRPRAEAEPSDSFGYDATLMHAWNNGYGSTAAAMGQQPRLRLWLNGRGYGSTATAMAQRPRLWLNGRGYGSTAAAMAQRPRLWLNGRGYGSTAAARYDATLMHAWTDGKYAKYGTSRAKVGPLIHMSMRMFIRMSMHMFIRMSMHMSTRTHAL